jgi:hypothetical protein
MILADGDFEKCFQFFAKGVKTAGFFHYIHRANLLAPVSDSRIE